jgi:hypothetical protein
MAQSFEFLPDGDIENDGWTIVGGSATKVWEVLRYYYDDCYMRVPAYRGGLEVKFPFDYSTQFPTGGIIDSITVKARMSTSAGSGARGVTINVLSTDNRSRYTTRTLYANSNVQEYEVGTYSKDPLGRPWDIHRLNKLRLRAFSNNNLSDSIRLYGLWVVVNFHTKPSASVVSPSGTVNTPSPLVQWQYIQDEGEPQKFGSTRSSRSRRRAPPGSASRRRTRSTRPRCRASRTSTSCRRRSTTTSTRSSYG